MSSEGLHKKSPWDVSLTEFKSKFIKDIYLNPAINADLRSEVEVISDLLLHSYYNSHFIDEAYVKAIFTLEKALRIRCKDLNNGMEDAPLIHLMKWFFENDYFETTEISELHQLRNIRNSKVHSPEISKGFLNYLVTIYSIFDLMNDVYEDVALRLARRKQTNLLNQKLNILCKDGFIFAIENRPYIGHFARVLFYNNKSKPNILHLRVARCILSNIAHLGGDRDNYELAKWVFAGGGFTGELNTGETVSIVPLVDKTHLKQFKDWLKKYSVWRITLFDIFERTAYEEKLRQFHNSA